MYAAAWQIEIRTSGRTSGGPGSGIYRSTDGGDTWTLLEGAGLPAPPLGKIGLAVSADDPDRLYALIETSSNRDFAPSDPFAGVLWRSDDRGDSWRLVSRNLDLITRPLYYTRMAAAPDRADEITFVATRQWVSLDGGRTVATEGFEQPGWDHHDIWIDPLDPDRRIVGHDGGVSVTHDRGRSWYRPQLPIAQMYHVSTDDRVPYFVYGNRQDGPSMRGPSRVLYGGRTAGIPVGEWHSVGGCEVGFSMVHRADNDLVWTGCYDGQLELYDLRSGQSRDVSVWPLAIEGSPASELEYRFQWTAPFATSPHDPEAVYAGSQYVHRSRDRGQSWERISPDLTTADPALMRRTGGLTLDDAGPTIAPVVFAIAESPLEPGLIWAGTNDGQVQLTRDGGATWTNVTANLPGLPPLGTVRNIDPSDVDAGAAYVAVDRHQEGDTTPYAFRTNDYGETWTDLAAGLPRGPLGNVHAIREDPEQPGLLFLGAENALHVSFDDGGNWRRLSRRGDGGANLPPAPVHWIEVQERFDDLVVATYGRGIWILDDLTPLREIARGLTDRGPTLLPPRAAYRFRTRGAPMAQPDVPASGTNPPYGALLHYWIPAPSESSAASDEPPGARVFRPASEETAPGARVSRPASGKTATIRIRDVDAAETSSAPWTISPRRRASTASPGTCATTRQPRSGYARSRTSGPTGRCRTRAGGPCPTAAVSPCWRRRAATRSNWSSRATTATATGAARTRARRLPPARTRARRLPPARPAARTRARRRRRATAPRKRTAIRRRRSISTSCSTRTPPPPPPTWPRSSPCSSRSATASNAPHTSSTKQSVSAAICGSLKIASWTKAAASRSPKRPTGSPRCGRTSARSRRRSSTSA